MEPRWPASCRRSSGCCKTRTVCWASAKSRDLLGKRGYRGPPLPGFKGRPLGFPFSQKGLLKMHWARVPVDRINYDQEKIMEHNAQQAQKEEIMEHNAQPSKDTTSRRSFLRQGLALG